MLWEVWSEALWEVWWEVWSGVLWEVLWWLCRRLLRVWVSFDMLYSPLWCSQSAQRRLLLLLRGSLQSMCSNMCASRSPGLIPPSRLCRLVQFRRSQPRRVCALSPRQLSHYMPYRFVQLYRSPPRRVCDPWVLLLH